MSSLKRDHDRAGLGARAYLIPLAWIAALLASYLLLAQWQTLPQLFSSALAAI